MPPARPLPMRLDVMPDPAPVAPAFTFQGPWFTAREACAYIPCKTIGAWYAWRKRHGIITRTNGTVAKADLDRALSPRNRRPRRQSPTQLANLKNFRPRGEQ